MKMPAIVGTSGSANGLRSYRANVVDNLLDEDGQLIEWVIGFAFDTLGAQHVELRVIAGSGPGSIDAGGTALGGQPHRYTPSGAVPPG